MDGRIDLLKMIAFLDCKQGKTFAELEAKFGVGRRTIQRRLAGIKAEFLDVEIVNVSSWEKCSRIRVIRRSPFESEAVRKDQLLLVGSLRLAAKALRCMNFEEDADDVEDYVNYLMRNMDRQTRVSCERDVARLVNCAKFPNLRNFALTPPGVAKRLQLAVMAERPVQVSTRNGCRVTGEVIGIICDREEGPSAEIRSAAGGCTVKFSDVVDVKGLDGLLGLQAI